ncbi:MAG: hypothetical protein EXS63_00425 [Candidatus Omnitrophica bacterium]|nr:hypothetical protein [Candidatus Omnitrophota bacterium]
MNVLGIPLSDFQNIFEKMKLARTKTPRFHEEAYFFLMEALTFTVSKLAEPRHITGPELLFGIREFTVQRFGKMSKTVLNHWGIFTTDDFGQIVFDLVDAEVLRKQPNDKFEDFHAVYDFHQTFEKDFIISEDV